MQSVHDSFSFYSLLLQIFVFSVSLSVSQYASDDVQSIHLLEISVQI